MKSLFKSLLLLSVAGLATAHAQVYVEGAAGVRQFRDACKGVSDCKERGLALRGTLGYGFGNGLSAEAGYAEFGKAKGREGTNQLEARAGGFTLGAAARLPLTPSLNADLRVGAIRMDFKGTSTEGSSVVKIKSTKVQPYLGAGLSYSLSKETSIGIGAMFTRLPKAAAGGQVQALELSLRQQF